MNGGEATRPAFIGGMYRIGDLTEAADPGGDHRGGIRSCSAADAGDQPAWVSASRAATSANSIKRSIFCALSRDGRQRVEAVQRIAVNGRPPGRPHFAGNIRDQLLAEPGDP